MNFRTRIDLTDRQAKQYEKTNISLSGASTFGLPYSALTAGPNLTMTGVTFGNGALQSTYSGNNTTTIYTFGDSRMTIDEGDLVTLTPSNSGDTQFAGPTWSGYNMFTTVDGYNGWTNYSAVTYDLNVSTMNDLGGGAYSGVVISDFTVYSATSIDWTGSTIWLDVSGITRTNELIITNGATNGYVLTSDSEGKGSWSPISGGTDIYISGLTYSGNTLILEQTNGSQLTAEWTGSTSADCVSDIWVQTIHGCPSLALRLDGRLTRDLSSTSLGTGSMSLGTGTTADGLYATSFGKGSRAIGNYSIAGGGSSSIPTWSGGTAIGMGSVSFGINSMSTGIASFSLGAPSFALGNFSFAGGASIATGSASFSFGNESLASGGQGFAIGTRTKASGLNSFAGGHSNQSGYTHSSGVGSFVFMTNSGTTECGAYAQHSAILGGVEHIVQSGATNSVIIGGQNITGTTANMVYVPDLVIDGLTSTDPLATDVNGKIVAGASDMRLKQNIVSLTDSLNKIKQLRGVEFEWTTESNMGDGKRFGLIAQEVGEVIPEMVRPRSKGDGMLTLNYSEIIPWLIESVKELSYGLTIVSGDTTSEIKTDEYGRWIATPALSSKHMILPEFTPITTTDERGMLGDTTWDDKYIYVKTNNGWKRSNLENF
jgi:hypothetical protein